MSISSSAPESALVASIRPRLHPALLPLFDQHNACLPALEKTCQKILTLAGGMTGADQLARLVSRDPGLTCKVLQVSNSIAYSPQQVITSVPHAVTWLGLDTIRSIVTAAQLVEQLHEWPDRQQVITEIIERALMAAIHAHELGAAIEQCSLNQVFSSTLLYSIGDFAVAHQAPDLYHALRDISRTGRTRAAQVIEETKLLGVPRARLAQALAQMWALPPHLAEVFAVDMDSLEGRWHSGPEAFAGLVVGSVTLIDAMTGPASRTAVETAKRTLLTGTGLPSHVFGDILVRALDRGKQLIRSAGLSTSNLLKVQPEPRGGGVQASSAPAPTSVKAVDPSSKRGPSAMETKPLEVLRCLQTTMQEAKDLNTLLGALMRALYRDAGFARVALALLTPHDSDQLIGRLLVGVDPAEAHLAALSGSLSKDHPCVLALLKGSEPVLFTDFTAPARALNPRFLRLWNPASAILAPLRIGHRPIGMLYCDGGARPNQISPEDYQAFQLFFNHTTLSMNRLAGIL
jgi:HD-like signal output (HDOD) protein